MDDAGGTDRRRLAVLSLLVQAAGCGVLALAGAQPSLLLLGVALVGLGIGNATSLPPLIAQVEFAPAEAPRVVALIVAISQGAYAFAPAAFGLLRQAGSDRTIFAVAIVIQVAARACTWREPVPMRDAARPPVGTRRP